MSAPWASPGWQAQAEVWILTEMACLREPVRTIQMVKNWCISVVQRVETTNRIVFFKASLDLPLFVNEGRVMTGLAHLYSYHVPAPFAVYITNNWMLLEDLGQPVGREASIETKADLFRTIAYIQIDLISRIEILIEMAALTGGSP